MSLLDAAAGVAVLAGALLQSAVGFGFALVCAPLLFAAAGPQQAVGLLNVLALAVNTISLLGEGRRPRPLARLTLTVLAWSAPGMLAGVVVLRNADARVLQVALTAAVFVTLAVRGLAGRRGSARAAPAWAPPATGLASGVLTTTLSTAGPPLVLLLLGRGHAPARVRDTLVTIFVAQSILGIAALAVTGTRGAIPDPLALAALIPIALAGQLAGRPLFARLAADGGYERVLTVVLVISAAIGLAAVLS